jgi:hypothetical protein
MTQEQLRMQMLAGIITEGQYKEKLKELNTDDTYSHGVDGLRARMEKAITQINNDKNLSDEEKEKRIDNVRFAVYNSIDPITGGGVRPSKDFTFDDNWWASTYETAGDFAIQVAFEDIKRAVEGDSFSGTVDETKKSLKENFVGMGAINNPFIEREKTGYETAFEHFLGARYELNENEGSDGTTVGTLLGMLNSINPSAEISLNYDGKMGTEVKALNYVDNEMANDEDQPEIILVGETEEGHMTVGELKSELSKLNPSTYVTLNLDLDSGTVVVDNIDIDSEMANDEDQPEIILFGS